MDRGTRTLAGMQLAVRADASLRIGSGHVMRCLALAEAARAMGARVRFYCRAHEGDLARKIGERGFPVHLLGRVLTAAPQAGPDLPAHADWLGCDWRTDAEETAAAMSAGHPGGKADWLLVDHYALDHRWESAMRAVARRILVVDDLADRRHDCDALLDQNYHPDAGKRYAGLVPSRSRLLLGPASVLLRPEFHAAKRDLRVRDGSVRRIHVFYGGSDPTDETGKALAVLAGMGLAGVAVDVVVGGMNPRKDRIREACRVLPGAGFHCDAPDMAKLLSRADLCLGAGGSATWERCCLGVPAVVTIIAENQARTTRAVHGLGALLCLGTREEVDADALRAAIARLLGDPTALRTMSRASLALMAGARGIDEIVSSAFAD